MDYSSSDDEEVHMPFCCACGVLLPYRDHIFFEGDIIDNEDDVLSKEERERGLQLLWITRHRVSE